MYQLDEETEILSRPAVITIPVNIPIHKLDIVEELGAGIWFADTDLPSIIIRTETEDQAIDTIKGFNRSKLKSKIKVVKGK